jgi:hypothetical protein
MGHGGYSDEVKVPATGDRILTLVNKGHLPVWRSDCGNLLERQGRELEISYPAELVRRRIDEQKSGRSLTMAAEGLNDAHPACSILCRTSS